jgi:hypothetical protein
MAKIIQYVRYGRRIDKRIGCGMVVWYPTIHLSNFGILSSSYEISIVSTTKHGNDGQYKYVAPRHSLARCVSTSVRHFGSLIWYQICIRVLDKCYGTTEKRGSSRRKFCEICRKCHLDNYGMVWYGTIPYHPTYHTYSLHITWLSVRRNENQKNKYFM